MLVHDAHCWYRSDVQLHTVTHWNVLFYFLHYKLNLGLLSVYYLRWVTDRLFNVNLGCTFRFCDLSILMNHLLNILTTLATSSDRRNVTVWRPSVCLSRLFLTLIEQSAHTHRDSPEGSTRRGFRLFVHFRPSITTMDYGHRLTCY